MIPRVKRSGPLRGLFGERQVVTVLCMRAGQSIERRISRGSTKGPIAKAVQFTAYEAERKGVPVIQKKERYSHSPSNS